VLGTGGKLIPQKVWLGAASSTATPSNPPGAGSRKPTTRAGVDKPSRGLLSSTSIGIGKWGFIRRRAPCALSTSVSACSLTGTPSSCVQLTSTGIAKRTRWLLRRSTRVGLADGGRVATIESYLKEISTGQEDLSPTLGDPSAVALDLTALLLHPDHSASRAAREKQEPSSSSLGKSGNISGWDFFFAVPSVPFRESRKVCARHSLHT